MIVPRGAAAGLTACLAAVALGWLICGLPNVLISSDSLLPAEFVWDAVHHSDGWWRFQQARVPSFFPDMTILGGLQLLTGSWRLAMTGWVFAAVLGLIAMLASLTARLAGCDRATAISAVLLVAVPLLTAAALIAAQATTDVQPDAALLPFLFVLLPFFHGGPFLLALGTAMVAQNAVGRCRRGRLAALLVLCIAVSLSDLLCLTSLLLPLTAALAAGVWARAMSWRGVAPVLATSWFGAGLGWAGSQLLYRQPTPAPPLTTIPLSLLRFMRAPIDHPDLAMIGVALTLCVAADAARRGRDAWLADFWPVFAASAAFGSFALMALSFNDGIWSFRYALPFLWWPVIHLAALLARLAPGAALLHRGSVVVTLVLAVLVGRAWWHPPGLLTWTSPLQACLEDAGLRAGLAEYWVARRTSASADWRLQIEPIAGLGDGRLWGNDPSWFAHDIHQVDQPPPYRFVIMDRLTPDRITAAYGPADRVLSCGGSTIWIYDDKAALFANLMRVTRALGAKQVFPASHVVMP